MKKAFTLVELLIVVVVIVTLMSMTFRLAGLGEDQEARNITITRMQKLENALSGYYAAYGTYPPVALHGTHNIYAKVDAYGIQSPDEVNTSIWGWNTVGEQAEQDAWRQVEAACRAQPVDCRYPFPDDAEWTELITEVSEGMKMLASDSSLGEWGRVCEEKKNLFAQGFDALNGTLGRFGGNYGKTSWQEIQVFKYGLLSYLLPRYLIMMQGDDSFYERFAQWRENNSAPCDPFTGRRMDWTGGSDSVKELSVSDKASDLAKVANIPSQAICARWLPNFEKTLSCVRETHIFGIQINAENDAYGHGIGLNLDNMRENIKTLELFCAGPYNKKNGAPYILDGITITDGWGKALYYYSPTPYQGYTLWSSGKNERTFPPWLRRDLLDSQARRCTGIWIADDIMHLSN